MRNLRFVKHEAQNMKELNNPLAIKVRNTSNNPRDGAILPLTSFNKTV